MKPQLPLFKGRRPWLESSAQQDELGYSGPADGDFASYVDRLMARAEAQRRAQAHLPAPVRDDRAPPRSPLSSLGQLAQPRPSPPQPVKKAATGLERAHARSIDAAQKPIAAQAWYKLLPFALWAAAVLTMVFWETAALWLIGLLIVGGVLFNAARKALRGNKP